MKKAIARRSTVVVLTKHFIKLAARVHYLPFAILTQEIIMG